MGAGGGAVVAIMAAARAKRMEDILDAYRVAGATSADRAIHPSTLELPEHESEVADFVKDGVLVEGRGGTMYLDEGRYVAYRERSSSKTAKVVLIIVVVSVLMLAAIVMIARPTGGQ